MHSKKRYLGKLGRSKQQGAEFELDSSINSNTRGQNCQLGVEVYEKERKILSFFLCKWQTLGVHGRSRVNIPYSYKSYKRGLTLTQRRYPGQLNSSIARHPFN